MVETVASTRPLPEIIQGGMGVAVSDWRLANTVARTGQLGVISATGIDTVLVRRLQDGDEGGHMRRALAAFPIRRAAEGFIAKYFLPEGREPGKPYALLPMYKQVVRREREEAQMLGAFAEVWLAKEGHDGLVGANLLTKIQRPNLAALYGAMLAGVDYILMGAGIPREIPPALDAFAKHEKAQLKMDVLGLEEGRTEYITLDPADHWDGATPTAVTRPAFLAIISSNSLATMLARKGGGGVQGFIIEGPTAGGHNAPPRGTMILNDAGEPIYGERDVVDLCQIGELGLPFWLAGGEGWPERLGKAKAAGAAGIQVGTLFAFSNESGFTAELKRSVLESALRGEVAVRTDPLASPTGYPFKVVTWSGDKDAGIPRKRICDLGYLRTAYVREDKKISFRCASEPIDDYVKKGGDVADTTGRRCLCNSLMANINIGQFREEGFQETQLLTSGDDLTMIAEFLQGRTSYSAVEVVEYLLAGTVAARA
ncbi:MAG: nitronate monooxygenase [Gemmatimonadales bacterium]|nr:nitronate monooxygenase [Gemmatimonadales bacterium]